MVDAAWAGKKILVTGASGMLGRSLLSSHLLGAKLTGVSRKPRSGLTVCDLAEPSRVGELLGSLSPDLVLHAAAYSDVDGCERDPQMAHASNALSTKHLSDLCTLKAVPLVYVSTNYIFSGQKTSPYVEEDEAFPVNIYGLTKLEGEHYVRQRPGPWAIVRTSWLFGAGSPKSFVNAVLDRMRREEAVPVLTDQTDSPTYVADLSEALERVVGRLLTAFTEGRAPQETFHICNRGQTTRFEMARRMKEWCGLEKTRVTEADRKDVPGRLAIRPAYSSLSSALYEKTFSTKLRDWKDALREYVTTGTR